jgi:hypothetical protein
MFKPKGPPSMPDAFFVNSFIIEGERSVILIDTQFVLSEATAVTNRIADLGNLWQRFSSPTRIQITTTVSPPSWRNTQEPESMQLPN